MGTTPPSDGKVYSQRLGPISEQQFEAALACFDLGRFVSAEPTTGGLFGQNVFVTTTRGRFVLRGCPHWAHQFAGERFFARNLHEHTEAPAPWPYLYEESKEIFGWSFAFMPRMPGESAGQDRGPDGNRGVARAVGENLARAQRLTFPAPGEYDPALDGIKPYAQDYPGWLAIDMRDRLERCQKSGCITADDVRWFDEVVADTASAWAGPWQPCFVQNDYQLGNLNVEQSDGRWRVSGQFDLCECRCGDGEGDLLRVMGWYLGQQQPCGRELAQEFVAGYTSVQPLRAGFERRWRVHALRNLMTFWEYGHSLAKWYPADLTMRACAQGMIDWPL